MSTPDLHAIQRAHGGFVTDGGRRWVGPGPGHSRRDASLSVRVTDDGRALVHSFSGDPFPACAAHLGLGRNADKLSPLIRREVVKRRQQREAEQRRINSERGHFCATAWAATAPIGDTPAETYLRGARAITGELPGDLRYHPAAPLNYEHTATAPALVAVVRTDGGPRGLHVTALRSDGSDKLSEARGRSARRMFGSVGGGCVQLGEPDPDAAELAVAEGIETALAFRDLHGVPCWAALSTTGLTRFRPPLGLRRLYVAADADGPGMAAARELAARVRRLCTVVITPPDRGDWNDVLRRAA